MICKGCWRCFDGKRNNLGLPVSMGHCPHATDHRLKCTSSNDPDQAGSMYSNYNFKTAE